MRRLPLLVLLLLIAAASAFVLATADRLPGNVATHFGAAGGPDNWMTQRGYSLWMLFFVTGFPLFMVAMIGGLPRLIPNFTNVPNRAYWMAPERRAASLRYLAEHACWLGCLITLTGTAVHWAILEAHRRDPVRLDTATVVTVVVGFVLFEIGWIALLWRRFRRPA